MNQEKGNKDWATTVTAPPGDLVKIIILQRHYDLMDSIESYMRFHNRGGGVPIYEIRARLHTLWMHLEGALLREAENNKEDFEAAEKLLRSDKIDDLLRVVRYLNKWLDTKKLTRFDTRDFFDRTRPELSNLQEGL